MSSVNGVAVDSEHRSEIFNAAFTVQPNGGDQSVQRHSHPDGVQRLVASCDPRKPMCLVFRVHQSYWESPSVDCVTYDDAPMNVFV